MSKLENLKKKILYRSSYRGTKEMDILLTSFVKKHIQKFDINELQSLDDLLKIEDEIIYNFYYKNVSNDIIENNKIAPILKKFKIKLWRRGWDSNPRTSCPVAGFQDQCFQPLSHLSLKLIKVL